jgi:phosphomannomutase
VVVDGVNSTGGIAVPALLEALGVEPVKLYCTPNGEFPHNPEPLKEHLGDLMDMVVDKHADFGIVVDPDVDRLAFVDENGNMFGEEYTLVAVADYVLQHTPGNTVSNMSSSRALNDITKKRNGTYTASAVGEVNVVAKMKETNAVIGGEGNGGIIYPELHYGRDSLVGIALFLSYLADLRISVSSLRKTYTSYFMSKKKIQLTPQLDVDRILKTMEQKYASEEINTIDGVKIDFEENWVHLRKSNTEPIIRIYTEAKSQEEANLLADKMINEIKLIAD